MDDAHTPEVTATGERAILESGELHRLLVERVSDYAIFALDPRGHILTWNAGAERLTGYGPKEPLGSTFRSSIRRRTSQQGSPREMSRSPRRRGESTTTSGG